MWWCGNAGDTTHPVGEKQPNPFGLFDMHGNIWEWCNDRYAGEYYKSSPENDPLGPTKATFRVYRGGCWFYAVWYCKSSYRSRFVPTDRINFLVFRVAADPSGE